MHSHFLSNTTFLAFELRLLNVALGNAGYAFRGTAISRYLFRYSLKIPRATPRLTQESFDMPETILADLKTRTYTISTFRANFL